MFHLLGLSALAVQILTLLLLFGATAIVLYSPPWLDTYLIFVYTVVLALWMSNALQTIARAEGLAGIMDKALNDAIARMIAGKALVGGQLVRTWRKVLKTLGRQVDGPQNTRRAVRLLILGIELAVFVLAYRLAGLPLLILFYVPAFTLFGIVLAFYLIGRVHLKREPTVATMANTSGELPGTRGSNLGHETTGKRELRRFLFLAISIGVSFSISVVIIIGVVLAVAPGGWLRTFRLVGLVFNITGAFASLVPRAMRERDEIEAQSAAIVGGNPHVRASMLRDTRVAQFGIALLAVGFFLQLIGNLG